MVEQRGFAVDEYRARVRRAQAGMAERELAALLVTTEADVRYFSGFLTRFWESPTRPWFLIVPAHGDPVAVIPSIGAPLMARTWLCDIRTWSSPDPGNDGVSLLADTLRDLAGPSGSVGLPMGPETHLRMPLGDFSRVAAVVAPLDLVDDNGLVRALRAIKSPAEIEKITMACSIAGRAFARIGEIASAGTPLDEVFRRFQMLCLDEGADWVPYLAGGAGPGGYEDVISPATGGALEAGDVLMLDTGLVWDGYFCDFDRNFQVGRVGRTTADAHARLIEAVEAAMSIARPGTTASQLAKIMNTVVSPGSEGNGSGRLGHGLGMQLTEPPSLMAQDHTVLETGMVLTLEPVITLPDGRILVHEENIVIETAGARFLSPVAGPQMPEI